jgi:hypothetical protein
VDDIVFFDAFPVVLALRQYATPQLSSGAGSCQMVDYRSLTVRTEEVQTEARFFTLEEVMSDRTVDSP